MSSFVPQNSISKQHEIRFSDFQTHLRSRSQELSIHAETVLHPGRVDRFSDFPPQLPAISVRARTSSGS